MASIETQVEHQLRGKIAQLETDLATLQKRCEGLSRMIWEKRYQSDDADYKKMVGIAAEMNSGNFETIDSLPEPPTPQPASECGERK